MNPRILKLKEEYEKNENKIVSLQAKNKSIAEKIRQLENADIIGAVRESGFSIDELLSLLGKTKKALETNIELEDNDNEI